MFTLAFWQDALERGIKTGAQAVVGVWFVEATGTVSAFNLDWKLGLGVFAGGIVLSLLTSIASTPFSNKGTASLDPNTTYIDAG